MNTTKITIDAPYFEGFECVGFRAPKQGELALYDGCDTPYLAPVDFVWPRLIYRPVYQPPDWMLALPGAKWLYQTGNKRWYVSEREPEKYNCCFTNTGGHISSVDDLCYWLGQTFTPPPDSKCVELRKGEA